MVFYSGLFFVIVLISLIPKKKIVLNLNKSKYKIEYHSWVIVFFLISLIIGLRYDVGTDFMNYIDLFQRYQNDLNINLTEYGFQFMNKAIIYLGLNYWVSFLISAILINFLIFKLIKEESQLFFLSVIILFKTGFIFMQTNQIRQSIAIAFVFYGSKYIFRNNFKRYILCCLFAMSFHFSAVIMIPIYYISKKRWNKYFLIILLFVSLLLFMNPSYLEVLTKFFVRIFALIFQKYDYYLREVFQVSSYNSTGYKIILEILLTMFIILLTPNSFFNSNKRNVLYNLFIIGFISKGLLGRFSAIGRLSSYFMIFQTLFIPSWIFQLKINMKSKKIIVLIVSIYYTFWVIWAIKNGVHGIIPYEFIVDF